MFWILFYWHQSGAIFFCFFLKIIEKKYCICKLNLYLYIKKQTKTKQDEQSIFSSRG